MRRGPNTIDATLNKPQTNPDLIPAVRPHVRPDRLPFEQGALRSVE
jgi:hypothetical protein